MLPFAATWNLENIILSDVSLIEKDKYHIISCICEILKKNDTNEAQARSKISGRNISNLRYADDTTFWQKVKN